MVGVDTEENEHCKVCPLSVYRSPRFFVTAVIYVCNLYNLKPHGQIVYTTWRDGSTHANGHQTTLVVTKAPPAPRDKALVDTVGAPKTQRQLAYAPDTKRRVATHKRQTNSTRSKTQNKGSDGVEDGGEARESIDFAQMTYSNWRTLQERCPGNQTVSKSNFINLSY